LTNLKVLLILNLYSIEDICKIQPWLGLLFCDKGTRVLGIILKTTADYANCRRFTQWGFPSFEGLFLFKGFWES